MENVLLEMGFKPNFSGFYYTIWILENCRIKELINMQEVYKKTAIEFETTPGAIERAIRNLRKKCKVYDTTPNKQFLNILKIKLKYEKDVAKKIML